MREQKIDSMERARRLIKIQLRQWTERLREGYTPNDAERAEIRNLVKRKNVISDELNRLRSSPKNGPIKWAGATSVPGDEHGHKSTENASTRLATYGIVPMGPRMKVWS